ncbi:TPA: MFS transporter [Elizabethkingia meningoseptica]|uniref:hypothetical protein n=1 Tax=Elizabethkingia meningoseptica TaxID=238 RepID=UPI0022F16973|nr:hypothetical protein [Elizabethkingia meningoseptica]EJK5328954.1 hypothetical protein [Elizabethkingia meningoseptica]WBS75117.1 hypothetical protein PF438_01225 [Elizabethkingia meningoseptica]HAY3562636.1 MFS transporter [Elizabethkingia meningoseptica]
MVKKNILEKLSDPELNIYISSESRFTPEAIQMAFEILNERGHQFSDQERALIQKMIQEKKDAEIAQINEDKESWEDNITNDPSAIKLYQTGPIAALSFFCGLIPGAILVSINFIKVKKYSAAFLVLLYGIVYFFAQKYLITSLIGYKKDYQVYSRHSPELIVIALGVIGLTIISALVMPKKLPHRPESYILPAIMACAMAVIMYLNPHNEYLSYYLIPEIIAFFK